MRVSIRLPFLGLITNKHCAPHGIYTAKVLIAILLLAGLACFLAILVIESQSFKRNWNDRIPHKFSHLRPESPENYDIPTDDHDESLHYGVIIDCGSSGSRVYVYFWPQHQGHPNELLKIRIMKDVNSKPVVKKIEPGISVNADHPSRSDGYLKPLLDFAALHVPKHKHKETPLYVMATAGMRMLSLSQQQGILQDIRMDIPLITDFLFQDSHAEVITGKQEGVYAWITINYILGKLDHSADILEEKKEETNFRSNNWIKSTELADHQKQKTVGIIDMGGASVQIAYEVPSERVDKSMLAEFNLGCTKSDKEHSYRIYVVTFLGFGANMARLKYEDGFVDYASQYFSTPLRDMQEQAPILDPCMPLGYKGELSKGSRTFKIHGSGQMEECMAQISNFLNMSDSKLCPHPSCAMNDVHLPLYNDTQFYSFSEFYYTMEDVLRMAGPYKREQFHAAAQDYCGTSWATLQEWYEKNYYPKADHNRFLYQCFKSAWMSLILHEGFHFHANTSQLTSAQMVNGQDSHWSLGAILYKTRYFPLSQMQSKETHAVHHPPRLGNIEITYILLFCTAIVFGAICLYIRRLRIVKRSDLRKIPSMAYFMTDENQKEDGIFVEKYFA